VAKEVKGILGDKGLDILISNIGIGQEGFLRPHEATAEILSQQFEVNVIGPHLITTNFVPLMKNAEQKIIVNT